MQISSLLTSPQSHQITLTPYAGAKAYDANAYLLGIYDRFNLLLDAGFSNEKSAPWFNRIQKPDAIYISHAHLDHIGALGALFERFGILPVYASEPTKALSAYALAGHMRSKYGASKARMHAKAIASQIQVLPWFKPLTITKNNDFEICLTICPAGHIPGASLLRVDIKSPEKFQTIFYSGDFCLHDQPLTPGATLPLFEKEPDIWITEGVLSDKKHFESKAAHKIYKKIVRDFTPEKPRLFALSALGPALELSFLLYQQTEIKDHLWIHNAFEPVFKALKPFLNVKNSDFLAFIENKFVDQSQAQKYMLANHVVIAPGEFLDTHTPAGMLANHLWHNPDAHIGVLNSVRWTSPAGRALKTKPGKFLNLKSYQGLKLADLKRYYLPNHAPLPDLVCAACQISARKTFLTHGALKGLEHFKETLEQNGLCAEILADQQTIIL